MLFISLICNFSSVFSFLSRKVIIKLFLNCAQCFYVIVAICKKNPAKNSKVEFFGSLTVLGLFFTKLNSATII